MLPPFFMLQPGVPYPYSNEVSYRELRQSGFSIPVEIHSSRDIAPYCMVDQGDFLQSGHKAQSQGASPGPRLLSAVKENNADIGVQFFATEYPEGLVFGF
jgi:hypothetical protein